jgi:hypothetical protein
MPSSIHLQAFTASAMHTLASPWAAQGSSAASGDGAPTIVVVVGVLLTPTLPSPQAQSQGGQLVPGAQAAGQAQVHVPPAVPPPQEPVPPLPPQSQLHGGQVWPGAQVGQAHVQVPPVPPPKLPVVMVVSGGFEQSHSTAGQAASAGQAIGCTQVHPPPEAPRA